MRVVVPVKKKNAKKTTTRAEKAALTRRRMLEAAYAELCEHGFRGTTMEAVAARAGVAVQTLYFTFHTKDALLQEVLDRAVLGDDPVVPAEQPWFQRVVAEPEIEDAVAAMVVGLNDVLSRVGPLVPVFHAVSADPAGAVYRHAEHLRREGYADLIGHLVAKAPLREGMTRSRAVDVVFVLLGPEVHRSLVVECGWTSKELVTWATATILRDLFDREPRRAPAKRASRR